jgi:acetoacetyl-CoA synthetase
MAPPVESSQPEKLWEHPNPEATQMAMFMRNINKKRNMNMKV